MSKQQATQRNHFVHYYYQKVNLNTVFNDHFEKLTKIKKNYLCDIS